MELKKIVNPELSEARERSTREQEAELCRRYRSGATTSVLAMQYGCTQPTVRNILKRNLGTLR